MGFLARLAWAIKGGDEGPWTSHRYFREVYGRPPSKSGQDVNWDTALGQTTTLACCKVIAEGVAQIPWRVYQDSNGGRKVADTHPLYRVIHRRPNHLQTSFEFRETILFHVLLTGNAFVFVNRVGSARAVRELVPIEPGRIEVKQERDGRIVYKVRPIDGGMAETFGADAIWHLRGPSWNSWLGLDATRMAREAIGLSMALEQGQAEFQKGDMRVSGVLAVKEKLTEERFKFLAGWLDKHLPGGDRAGKPIIADNDMEYSSMSMTAVDAQLIQTRKHQIEEICRAFRVMPIMVGHADKTATYASAEQMFLAHVVHTLAPWYERIEQSADVNLLSEEETAAGYYTKFTPNALMRGAANDRANFYKAALGAGGAKGWMTQNEVRGLEELDRSDDPAADELPQPAGAPKPDRGMGDNGGPPLDDPDADDDEDADDEADPDDPAKEPKE